MPNKLKYEKEIMHDYDIYKRNYPTVTHKQVINVFDAEYLDIEKDFSE